MAKETADFSPCLVTAGMNGSRLDRSRVYLFGTKGEFMCRKLIDFFRDEQGPTAVEYAVMLGLILMVVIAAVAVVGDRASTHFANVALTTAISGAP